MAKFKTLLGNRKRALVRLYQGKTINEVVEELSKKHPGVPKELVKAKYFPKTTSFGIQSFEGKKDRAAVLQKLKTWRKISEASRKNLTEVVSRPEIKAELAKRARKLASTPEARERSRQAMLKLHADPKYRAQTIKRERENLKRKWQSQEFRDRIVQAQRTIGKNNSQTVEWRERMAKGRKKFNSSPEYAIARKERGAKISAYAKRRHEEDAEYHETVRTTFTRLRHTPEFIQAMWDGMRNSPLFIAVSMQKVMKVNEKATHKRHSKEARQHGLEKAEKVGELNARGISTGVEFDKETSVASPTPVHTNTPLQNLARQEKATIFQRAFEELTELEKQVVFLEFGMESKNPNSQTQLGKTQRAKILSRALEKLKANPELREYFS